ncbi:MAG: ATP-binding protein [Proteobacteria bacterium]|nr:ATP-binding protein [Cystobacterineae bacterium]MCL2258869.1 ATP-binding protein [Cystobacterineae bacterium]MCL2314479.1 ATP-binding protein [Pseudomonadota bacterium]
MSIHLKVALVISSFVVAFTVALTGISIFLTRSSLVETMRRDLTAVNQIARDFVKIKITHLKADAKAVALRVATSSPQKVDEIFQEAKANSPDFLAFTIFGPEGVLVLGEESPASAQRLSTSEYLQKAFEGEETITTIREDEETKQLRIYINTPIDGSRVLAVAVDGLIFQKLLYDNFKLRHAGSLTSSLFMSDEHGLALVSPIEQHVTGRLNTYKPDAELLGDPDMVRWTAAFVKAIQNNNRTFDFSYGNGQEGIFSWLILDEITAGWVLGAYAPLEENKSVAEGKKMLLLAAAIFLGVSLPIVFVFSEYAAHPFLRIKEQNQNLKELNEAIVAANEAKSHFLANMSHEMRTPLNAVIGLTELTLNGVGNKCKPECTENLEKVFSAGSTLLNIINDILDISKINSGRFEIHPVEYELAELVSDAVSQNMVRLADKPVEFKLHINPSIPSHLFGDDLRVKQILNNLISNAFKYTRFGTISLSISFEKDKGEYLWLLFDVKDTGMGILPENLEKIFADYHQVHTKANRKIEGTGLGLPLTKHLVELMSGSISAESEYGHGSTFRARIRQKQVSPLPIGEEMTEELAKFNFSNTQRRRNIKLSRLYLPNAKVLVVDDMPINLDVAKGLMQPYGMQVDCVENGQAAIELVRQACVKYDAIFMDHMMPGMDGVEATRVIRTIDSDYARNIPIVALTANAVVGTEQMFLQNGFQAFIPKPVDIVQLDWVVRQWVQGKTPEETPCPSTKTETPTEAQEVEGLDVDKGVARLGGNAKTYWKIVHAYAQSTAELLKKIHSVSPETLEGYGIVVHGLKGSSRNIGADAVGDLAEALERAAKVGNFAFVQAHHAPFLEATEKLLSTLSKKLETYAGAKHLKTEPDEALLEALHKACESFDIDGLNQAMEALVAYEYSPGAGANLVAWLKERALLLDFEQMAKRLSKMKKR